MPKEPKIVRELDRVLGSIATEPMGPPPSMDDLHRRVRRRRMRRRVVVASAAVVVAASGAIALWPEDSSPRVEVVAGGGSTTTDHGTTAPPASSVPALAARIPDPIEPAEQVRVPLDRSAAPLAVGHGAVWVGTATGVAEIDPVSLETRGNVAIELSVVAVATGPAGVWILSGSQQSSFGGVADTQLPPYHLTLIDAVTRRVKRETDLPFRSSERGNAAVRLSASQDGAWVALGEHVVHVDSATGSTMSVKLGGYVIGNIAADAKGLWIATAGGMTNETGRAQVLRVDRSKGIVTVVPGIEEGFMWSIAAADDAAWLIEMYRATGEPEPVPHLVRIDADTRSTTAFALPAIAVVVGDNQVWVQVYDQDQGPAYLRGVVGQVDPRTGKIVRTVDIDIGGVPGSSGNGYNNPPFAVAQHQIWSAHNGIERTTL